MPGHDYLPQSIAELLAWLKAFVAWMVAHGAAHGFTNAEITELQTKVSAFEAAIEDCDAKENAYHASVQAKKHSGAEAVALTRADVKRLQADPTMTDADRADADITVRDAEPTPLSPDYVRELGRPSALGDWSMPMQLTLHWGYHPHNEHENAKPEHIYGVHIQYHIGGVPSNPDDWKDLDNDTRSPYIHQPHLTEPTTIAYRVCWLDNNLKKGPYSDPVVCTISV